eukprot:TRINITY_DN1251_c0_g1_i2.p1 TRINITY_DN1251_c0_g1~~TRINITY_DN1251_c0_g1_i2.p1  ORF type:complete len:436 (-),score=38.54 TRINITY_DN1251_c0_g1_i2:531-1775(-)
MAAMETDAQKQALEPQELAKRVRFNDASSSDVVVRLVKETAPDGAASEALYLHRDVLVAYSTYFSAQLSERWDGPNASTDVQGRRILAVRLNEAGSFEAFSVALRKLYAEFGASTGTPEKEVSFSGFQEAVLCLQPADQLGLESMYRSAVSYLQSIPWTVQEESSIAEMLNQTQIPEEKLLERTREATSSNQHKILAAAVANAVQGANPSAVCRRFIEKLLDSNPSRSQESLKRALDKTFKDLEASIADTLTGLVEHRQRAGSFQSLSDKLEWLFGMPLSLVAAEHSLALKRKIVDTVVPLKSDKQEFCELFWNRGLFNLHSVIVAEVIKGRLPLDVGCRKGLVEMWFLAYKSRADIRGAYVDNCPTSELALLSTLPLDDQVEVVQPVLRIISARGTWAPWLQCWMEKVCYGSG